MMSPFVDRLDGSVDVHYTTVNGQVNVPVSIRSKDNSTVSDLLNTYLT